MTQLTSSKRLVVKIGSSILVDEAQGQIRRDWLEEAYAKRTGDWAYVDALRLFVQEEQRHSQDMGRFLDAAGVPLWKSSWLDYLFRGVMVPPGEHRVVMTYRPTSFVVGALLSSVALTVVVLLLRRRS